MNLKSVYRKIWGNNIEWYYYRICILIGSERQEINLSFRYINIFLENCWSGTPIHLTSTTLHKYSEKVVKVDFHNGLMIL